LSLPSPTDHLPTRQRQETDATARFQEADATSSHSLFGDEFDLFWANLLGPIPVE
jgi:hypothetical protein